MTKFIAILFAVIFSCNSYADHCIRPNYFVSTKNPSLPNKDDDLITAIQIGDLPRVKQAVADGADVNVQCFHEDFSSNIFTPLLFACYQGSPDVVRFLLQNKADIFFKEKYPFSTYKISSQSVAFEIALARQHVETAKVLKEFAPELDVNKTYFWDSGKTPLTYGFYGDSKIAFLLDLGAHIDAFDAHGKNALMYAIVNQNDYVNPATADMSAAQMLINFHANIHAKDVNGYSVLTHAITDTYRMEGFNLLLQNQVDINETNADGSTALMIAVNGSNSRSLDIAKRLIDLGANVDAQDKNGMTALMKLAENNSFGRDYDSEPNYNQKFLEVAKLLIEKTSNLNALHFKEGKTLLIIASLKSEREFAKLLIDHGADVNAKDNFGVPAYVQSRGSNDCSGGGFFTDLEMTRIFIKAGAHLNESGNGDNAIWKAVSCNASDEIIKVLIKNHVDVNNGFNGSKRSPLYLALALENFKVAKILIESKANVNVKIDGATPLEEATVYATNFEIARQLISAGADPNAQFLNKNTPLMYAVYYNDLKFAQFLLKFKPDLSLRDHEGRTVLEIAIKNNDTEMVALLGQAGAK